MAKILIAEDEPGVRSFIAECLEEHDVTTAQDGEEALGLLRKSAFDLLITDLKMPKLSGMELLKAVKGEQPELEVLVLSAHGSVENAVQAMRLGAFDFVQKPIESPSALRVMAERALEHKGLKTHVEQARLSDDEGVVLSWGAKAMDPVVNAISRVAPTSATVLLLGESGTGKEVAARAVHQLSKRSGPFVAVNCAVLSDTLLESELFGHEKGAFTGADKRRRGKLELASEGTFFLDEIGELKPALQAKLLRALEERSFERVGGNQTIETNTRFVAATHRDLELMVSEGEFREDLFHRLSVFPVWLPPLSQRTEDVPELCKVLLRNLDMKRNFSLSEEALEFVKAATWKGNIRALRNALERAAILSDDAVIQVEAFMTARPPSRLAAKGFGEAPTMAEAERFAIVAALKKCEGNRKNAAAHLGIGERTLYDKLRVYKVDGDEIEG